MKRLGKHVRSDRLCAALQIVKDKNLTCNLCTIAFESFFQEWMILSRVNHHQQLPFDIQLTRVRSLDSECFPFSLKQTDPFLLAHWCPGLKEHIWLLTSGWSCWPRAQAHKTRSQQPLSLEETLELLCLASRLETNEGFPNAQMSGEMQIVLFGMRTC